MKKTLIIVSILILVSLLGVGTYFWGRQMNFFLSDEEIVARSFAQMTDLDSFEMGGNLLLPTDGGQLRFTLKQILPQAGVSAASDLLLEMKQPDIEGLNEEDVVETDSLEIFSLISKNGRTNFKIGDFPILALFGLGNFMGQWFYFDETQMQMIFDEAQQEEMGASNLLGALFGFSGGETTLSEMKEKKNQIFQILSDYVFNKSIFVLDEKLANSDINGQVMRNYSLKLDETLTKDLFFEMLDLINADEELTGRYKSQIEEEGLAFKLENIKVSIAKANLNLRELSFDLSTNEEGAEPLSIFLNFNNINRLTADSIEEPEALPAVEYMKYDFEEQKRASYYTQREMALGEIIDQLAVKCEEFTLLEDQEKAEIAALSEEMQKDREVKNLTLAVEGENLTLAKKLAESLGVEENALLDPEMLVIGETWAACAPNSKEVCDFAFGNPESGNPFNFNMTYIDPCNYWMNFYTDSGLIGHISSQGNAFPVYKERTFEEWQNNVIPETSYSDEITALDPLSNLFSVGNYIPMANSEQMPENLDNRRFADMTSLSTAMALSCSDKEKILLNADVFSETYVTVNKASASSYFTFTNFNDPSGVSTPCTNDASANCNYAFADKDGNGELLPLELNDEGKIIVDSCDYRINFYSDDLGAAYVDESGLYLANGSVLP